MRTRLTDYKRREETERDYVRRLAVAEVIVRPGRRAALLEPFGRERREMKIRQKPPIGSRFVDHAVTVSMHFRLRNERSERVLRNVVVIELRHGHYDIVNRQHFDPPYFVVREVPIGPVLEPEPIAVSNPAELVFYNRAEQLPGAVFRRLKDPPDPRIDHVHTIPAQIMNTTELVPDLKPTVLENNSRTKKKPLLPD